MCMTLSWNMHWDWPNNEPNVSRSQLISCMDGCAAHHGVQGAPNLLSAVTDIDLMKRKAAQQCNLQCVWFRARSARGRALWSVWCFPPHGRTNTAGRIVACQCRYRCVCARARARVCRRMHACIFSLFEGAATATGAKRRIRRAAEDKPMPWLIESNTYALSMWHRVDSRS